MKQRKWIRAADFVDKYGLSIDYLYVYIRTHKKERLESTKKIDGDLYIDENYFKRRKDFKTSVVNDIHAYYYLFEEYFSDTNIAKALHAISGKSTYRSINHFLQQGFRLDESSILNYKVPSLTWIVWRSFRYLMMEVLRFNGLKIPKGKRLIDGVERILDKRCKNTHVNIAKTNETTFTNTRHQERRKNRNSANLKNYNKEIAA